jgi:hypothetical protein
MSGKYDIFEQRPSLGAIWRASVPSIYQVHRKLEELAESTNNECFAIALASKKIIAGINVENYIKGATRKSPVSDD